jgi:hypothetical protein
MVQQCLDAIALSLAGPLLAGKALLVYNNRTYVWNSGVWV